MAPKGLVLDQSETENVLMQNALLVQKGLSRGKASFPEQAQRVPLFLDWRLTELLTAQLATKGFLPSHRRERTWMVLLQFSAMIREMNAYHNQDMCSLYIDCSGT